MLMTRLWNAARRRAWNAILTRFSNHGLHGVVLAKCMIATRAIHREAIACLTDYLLYRTTSHTRHKDRVFLENSILPRLATLPQGTSVLFVGVKWYTANYDSIFRTSPVQFVTLEIAPAMSAYGSSYGHVTADFLNTPQVLGSECYGVVVMQGVFGWGIDTQADFEKAIQNCYRLLRPDGVLIVGWNCGRAIEPDTPNIDKILRYFAPLDGFLQLPYCTSFDNPCHTYHIFRKCNADSINPQQQDGAANVPT